jgi:hypothetical protein
MPMIVERWRDRALTDGRRDRRTAAILGAALGVCMAVCFVTGLMSHWAQSQDPWVAWPARPAGLYRFSQGLHVLTGVAAVPLLVAKLWSVFPRLFQWPIVTDAMHLAERLSLLPLVGGSIFMLVTGVANIELWYPWVFFFPAGHYAVSFVVMGALLIHLVAKWAIVRTELLPGAAVVPSIERRRFLRFGAVAAVALPITVAGQTVRPLRKVSLLAPRLPDVGPQGFPVNKTAAEARVNDAIADPAFTLRVERGGRLQASFTLADLAAIEQVSATLPIACVEGWSANVRWNGVRVRDVLSAAGIDPDGVAEVVVQSVQRGGRYRRSVLSSSVVRDRDCLLATGVDGEPLHPDHGAPIRLIAPNRPGVLNTKWVHRLDVR